MQNFGSILRSHGGRLALGRGGNVTNFLRGAHFSNRKTTAFTLVAAPGLSTNAGTITGPQYAVDFATSSSANRLIVDPGATFNGAVNGNGGKFGTQRRDWLGRVYRIKLFQRFQSTFDRRCGRQLDL